jgi:hypothetical protein
MGDGAMINKPWGSPSNALVVRIDSYDNRILCGHLQPTFGEEQIAFTGTISFLQNIETLLDGAKYPQPFCSARKFQPVECVSVPTSASSHLRSGRIATFSLKILFRQNASWQGSLCWLENGQEVPFRSVLELLMLIDSALQS